MLDQEQMKQYMQQIKHDKPLRSFLMKRGNNRENERENERGNNKQAK